MRLRSRAFVYPMSHGLKPTTERMMSDSQERSPGQLLKKCREEVLLARPVAEQGEAQNGHDRVDDDEPDCGESETSAEMIRHAKIVQAAHSRSRRC